MILGTLYQQCKTCDIEARTFVDSNTRMTGFTILSAPAADLASCAKACLRVKQCASFNYDLSSRLCDLNSVSSTNHPEVMTHASRSLHSDIVEWPAMVTILAHARERTIFFFSECLKLTVFPLFLLYLTWCTLLRLKPNYIHC